MHKDLIQMNEAYQDMLKANESIIDAKYAGKLRGSKVKPSRKVIVFDVNDVNNKFQLDAEDVLTVVEWNGRDLVLDINGTKVNTSDVNGFEYVTDPLAEDNSTIYEFVGEPYESRNKKLYDVLVPAMGSAETIEGEILRAVNRIAYRYYNDGDYFFEGYGAETAGPAHSFLVNSTDIPRAIQGEFIRILDSIVNKHSKSYEAGLIELVSNTLEYIESKAGNYTPTKEDSLSYTAEYEDSSQDDYDDGYWGNEE